LTAFANTKGGKVLVGVYDNGIAAADFKIGKETIQKCLNEIKNKTQPSIIPSAEVIDYHGKSVIEFFVPEFPIKPVSFKGKYFKRVQNSNHQLSAIEISDVYMQSMQYSWDSYPYPRASMASLNEDKIRTFISKVNTVGRFRLPTGTVEALQKLRMLQDGIPTNAAMILFSKENLLHHVHIGRFKTPSLIIADKMINGNLYDVLEESMQTIIGHLKFAFEITGRTTQRTEIPEYPLAAVREALLNALIHRDYRSSTDVQIKIFDQRITFFNPGGLYGNITEADLLTDTYQASTRNKQISEALYLTHDIEKYGSGFVRIRQAITNYPTMKFNFRELGDGFILEFSYSEQKISTQGDKYTDDEKRINEDWIERILKKRVPKNDEISKDTVKDTVKEIINDTEKDTVKYSDTEKEIISDTEKDTVKYSDTVKDTVKEIVSDTEKDTVKYSDTEKDTVKDIISDTEKDTVKYSDTVKEIIIDTEKDTVKYSDTEKEIVSDTEKDTVKYSDTEKDTEKEIVSDTEKDTEKEIISDTIKDTEKSVKRGTKKMTSVQKALLKEISDNKFVTIPELSKKVRINLRNTKSNISKLKSKGLLKRIGPDKGGYWQIIGQKNK
jgi:ATP-dependent DNA helicase RecG